MKVFMFCMLVGLSGVSTAGDFGVFLSSYNDDLIDQWAPTSAFIPANTNALADVGTNMFYRVVVSTNDWAGGWSALPQAIKDAAKAKANDQRKNLDLFEAKLKASIKGLVKVINLRLPAAQKITADELKAAIKEEL